MGYRGAKPFDVPGLNKALEVQDLEESRNIYKLDSTTEGDLLKLAKERGVTGIAKWLHYKQITINGNPDTVAQLRSSMKFGTPRKLSSKASWVDRKPEKREPDTIDLHSIQEAETDSLAGYGTGGPLHAYKSVGELIEALRDAIKGHKSLLEDRNILHRDISENSIIITEAAIGGDPKGMLIDLDLAQELDSVEWSESSDWHHAVYGDWGTPRQGLHVSTRS
ncbi:hypothetical protein F5882DRAFT_387726 [Hyaloscypha sp. PMI_1271]|nr:hypothetical protein F5882DRAFT_387726 [Hyaloscypha sp. PMI_1271]